MGRWGASRLEALAAAGGGTAARLLALVDLGWFDQAEELAADSALSESERRYHEGRLAVARGAFLSALELLDPEVPAARRERARLYAVLGLHEDALALVRDSPEPADRLAAAAIHVEAGEPAPASLIFPADAAAAEPDPTLRDMVEAEALRVGGEIRLLSGEAAGALAPLRRARDLARACGAVTLEAVAAARLGEAHVAAGNRWRALRAVTRAVDLVASERVAAGSVAGVYLRAYRVYSLFQHPDLAEAALLTGHHRLIQTASGIDRRDLREGFLLDNPDCRQLVAAWKGEASWGSDIPRG